MLMEGRGEKATSKKEARTKRMHHRLAVWSNGSPRSRSPSSSLGNMPPRALGVREKGVQEGAWVVARVWRVRERKKGMATRDRRICVLPSFTSFFPYTPTTPKKDEASKRTQRTTSESFYFLLIVLVTMFHPFLLYCYITFLSQHAFSATHALLLLLPPLLTPLHT